MVQLRFVQLRRTVYFKFEEKKKRGGRGEEEEEEEESSDSDQIGACKYLNLKYLNISARTSLRARDEKTVSNGENFKNTR